MLVTTPHSSNVTLIRGLIKPRYSQKQNHRWFVYSARNIEDFNHIVTLGFSMYSVYDYLYLVVVDGLTAPWLSMC